ncbi:MAG TPA: aspartyl protease family protein, partial [Chitinophagaceae bacterium]
IIEQPDAKLLTRFSFQVLSGGIIVIEGKLDNFTDTLNFILDTGSGGISLDSSTTQYLGLKKTPSDKTIRGIGGVRTVEFAMDHTLHLPNLVAEDLDFHINDYSLLTSVYGLRIDGIIGYSFLRRYIVALNYDENLISIYSPGNFRYPRGGHILRPNFALIPMQPATIKDGRTVSSRFYFDTGAGLCFLLSEAFAQDSAVLAKNKIIVPTQAEGLGGKRPMNLTVMKEIRLGPYKFKRVPTYIFKDEFNVTSYPNTSGLIGNDLLRRFNVVLNYPDQSIHLLPNKYFSTPFDYSYTGLGIYMDEGDIVVDDVIKGSPGEKAGFKQGDVILSIENNFSRNIQVYRTLLQSVDSNVKVIVMRNGEAIMLSLNVRNILRKK